MNFPRQVDYSRSGRPLRGVHNPSKWEAWAPGNAGHHTRLGQLGSSSSTVSRLPTPPPSRLLEHYNPTEGQSTGIVHIICLF
ncbi:hypothetical protein SprV_0200561500 [Sparganum proliferum]